MDDEQTTPELNPAWIEHRRQELQESVERIDAGLIRHEPQEWEIRKAQNEMYELLCTEYEELWDDYCDLKQALQEIAALNPAWEVSAIQAVDKAKRLLKEHG